MLRFLTAGESHGSQLTVILEGMPAGVNIDLHQINTWLEARQGGYGRGGRMAIEKDRVQISSGLRGGKTLGSPITLTIKNKDWENWAAVMAPDAAADLSQKTVYKPRPGHVDLPGGVKFHHGDLRNVLERASARETAARVALGALVWQFLTKFDLRVLSHVVSLGPVRSNAQQWEWEQIAAALDQSPIYCADAEAGAAMVKAIDAAKINGETLGGVFEIRVKGLPPGLGSYVHWDRKLDGQLAQALMSIPGMKGVEIGLGFLAGALPGSQSHDPIYYSSEAGYFRQTNRAGGLEGGVTNGEDLLLRVAMKPIPTLMKPLASVDTLTKKPCVAATERSDVCAVPAASIVGKAVIGPVLANAILDKFGGDHLEEIKNAWHHYLDYVRGY